MKTNIVTTNKGNLAESAEMLADALAYSILLRRKINNGETVPDEIMAAAESMALNALNYYWALTGVKVNL